MIRSAIDPNALFGYDSDISGFGLLEYICEDILKSCAGVESGLSAMQSSIFARSVGSSSLDVITRVSNRLHPSPFSKCTNSLCTCVNVSAILVLPPQNKFAS